MPNTTEYSESDLKLASWFRAACRSGEALRIRTANQATGAETAKVAGVSKAMLWYYERNKKVPGLANAAKLGRVYQAMAKTLKGAGETW